MNGVTLLDRHARLLWDSWIDPGMPTVIGGRAWDFVKPADLQACKDAMTACLIGNGSTDFKVSVGLPKAWQIYQCTAEPIENVAAVVKWLQLPENPLILTSREHDVLLAICADESPKKTAKRLKITVSTVETFRAILRRKTGQLGTAGLARWAVRMGIIEA